MTIKYYSGKKVLVTGGSGFIGMAVCKKLVSLGAEVHSISRSERSSGDGITWWQGDLADIVFVRKIFQSINPEIVMHLASEVTGRRELEYVVPTLNANLVSSVNIMVCATETKCSRVVLAGSLEEPDETDSNPVPCSPYAAAKWASSVYARKFYALYGTPVVIARLFMVYGPMQQDLKKLIPYVSLSLIKKERPKLANGSRKVDWIYIDDVVEGLLLIGITPKIENTTIELGSGELHTTGFVANTLCELSKQQITPEFGAVPDRPMERIKRANVRLTKSHIAWTPKINLHEGLLKTYEWYKEQVNLGNLE